MPTCIQCGKEILEGTSICEKCANIKPGTFHDADSPEDSGDEDVCIIERLQGLLNKEKEHKLEVSDELVGAYMLFQKDLQPKTDLVYYPSCSYDVSPSTAFPNSHVVYVDIDSKSILALKAAGLEAHEGDAREYKPDKPVDVLILLNPGGTGTAPAELVARGGYVLCNDYHHTATEMRDNKDFLLVGIVLKSNRQVDEQILDRKDPEKYWEEITTDEELKQAPFSWGMINYSLAIIDLQNILGKEETDRIVSEGKVVVEYKKYLEAGKTQDPEKAETGLIVYKKDDQEIMLLPLPRKKGVTDDIFVFERVTKNQEDKL